MRSIFQPFFEVWQHSLTGYCTQFLQVDHHEMAASEYLALQVSLLLLANAVEVS